MCQTNVLIRAHTVGGLANLMFQQKSTAYSLIPPETCLWSWFCFLPLCKPSYLLLCTFFNPCRILNPSVFSWYLLIRPQTGSHFSHAFFTWSLWELETRTCLSRFASELQRKFCKTGVYTTSAPSNSQGLAGDNHILNLRPAIAIFLHHPEMLWKPSSLAPSYLRLGCHR